MAVAVDGALYRLDSVVSPGRDLAIAGRCLHDLAAIRAIIMATAKIAASMRPWSVGTRDGCQGVEGHRRLIAWRWAYPTHRGSRASMPNAASW
jgi:hypothetical protein